MFLGFIIWAFSIYSSNWITVCGFPRLVDGLLVSLLASHGAGGSRRGSTLGLLAASVLLTVSVAPGLIRGLHTARSLLPDQRTAGAGSGQGELGQGNGLSVDCRSTTIAGAGVARAASVGCGQRSRLVAALVVSTVAAAVRGNDGLNGQGRLHLVGIAADWGAVSTAGSSIGAGRNGGNGADADAL